MIDLQIRDAEAADLEAIIRLHEEDELGGRGDAWTAENRDAYEKAFTAIDRSPDNRLFVALQDGEVVGTFQLTFIPNLTGRGALRTKVESVKVKRSKRSLGIGARMMDFAADAARARGASLLELTSQKSRKDAHRFYERIGYSSSHEGFKRKL
ncbi:GNAT family N-acetyltransferase [Microvirga brassicacearum]|uniref:GNAT family N-acetyltransferase n=1 Tax=Microvirga brassicacearum TaxID=2580413 RepID=A0A5N3PIP1_9HYPH|nr:GNAT family N-acetyltransferase [Microvirga brassicacearum]KAB0269495.1 GNAT family N-acetyltransferase [Microvirga brassicacearum]